MSGNYTGNTDPAIRALVHSQTMLEVLQDGFLPEGLYRNVGDFGDGTQLQIPTIGEMTLFDLEENQPTPTSAIDTGKIFLNIVEHVGVAGYITDELKEDGYKAGYTAQEGRKQAQKRRREAVAGRAQPTKATQKELREQILWLLGIFTRG